MGRRYEEVKVLNGVYISSDFHYHFHCRIEGKGRDYTPDMGFLAKDGPYSYRGYPLYVHTEVQRQIAKKLRDGTFSFYEYDREGNRRYDELRYRNEDYEAHLLKQWEPLLEEQNHV